MSITDTYVELAIKASKNGDQGKLVDYLTEDAPLLSITPLEPASDGISDTAEILTSVDTVPQVEYDAPLVAVNTEVKMEQSNLIPWAAKMFVGEDKVKILKTDSSGYFMGKAPAILKATGGRMSLTIRDAMKSYSLENHNDGISDRALDAGGSNNTNSTIVAIKFVKGETTGLYNPDGWGDGKVFDIEKINGGALYEDPSSNVLGYGTRMKTTFGLKLVNPRNVCSIFNIDANADLGTINLDDLMSEAIENVRGADLLIMPPKLRRLIGNKFKGDLLRVENSSNTVNRQLTYWDDTLILTDYNLPFGTEADSTIS